jgi:radical SAM superfamily enzyme YgiQ (UPF0313 family)
MLLINPANGPSFWGLDHACALMGRRYSNAPLALLTVAALCPEHWDIRLVDENVEPVDLDEPCDLVGLTAMNVQASRAFALADAFRRRGRTVLLGGPYATLEPERCAPHADVLFVGEAERTLPQFCRDFEEKSHRARYEEHDAIDLGTSPVPRYDLLPRARDYASLPVQSSRGCPFACEFCDVIVMQGRRPRTKPVPRVLAEIEAIRRVGGDSIFFTDDNFIGNLRYTRDLLKGLVCHRQASGYAPLLFTQASINFADHPELVTLAVQAGFTRLFLGIESPRQASLRESGKRQNLHGDLLARIASLQRAGMMTWAGMIVGFDHDDPDVFEEQAKFLDEAGIAVAMVGMLNAPPRTPLFARLKAEGRIDEKSDWADNCSYTNIVPKLMTRAQLLHGYGELVQHLYRQENYAGRVLKNVLRMSPADSHTSSGARLPNLLDFADLGRAVAHYTLSRDPVLRRHFVPNFLKVLLQSPSRLVEAAIHLGLWQHFETYVPDLIAQVGAAEAGERIRERERAWTRSTAGAAPVAPVGWNWPQGAAASSVRLENLAR